MDGSFFEYLLVINPKGKAEEKVYEVKSFFNDNYKCSTAMHQPHITMLNFILLVREMEKRIILYLDRFLSNFKPFDVELHGFDHFLTHTLFIDIKTPGLIIDIVKGIRTKFRRYLIADKQYKPFFCTKPHLTIARKMIPEQFDKAWSEWE